jgi:mannose-1-phosphate guanylyltransferase
MYVVIMAGGGGTRLWPKSRLKKPKQLLAILGKESMLLNTLKRFSPLVAKNNIYIATNREQAKELKKELPDFKNLILEPAMRNTGPCIGLAATLLSQKTNAPVAFLPADHYIGNPQEFRRVLKIAFEIAKDDYLVTIGIKPTDADTGMGYIKINLKSKIQNPKFSDAVFPVDKFIEKPNKKTAEKFVKSGQYFWNAGMFIGRPEVILKLFEKYAPSIYHHLTVIAKNPQKLESEYQKMENISFDYAVAEKAQNMVVVPGDFDWSDIGNWGRLLEKLASATNDNVVIGCEHYGVDTSGCLIHGTERVVATIGLKDIIVVDTPDAVLVCHKDKAQDVRKIVEKLKEEKKHHLL